MVDARVGPGLKSMTKFKKRKEESAQQQSSGGVGLKLSAIPERFSKIFKKNKKKKFIEKTEDVHGNYYILNIQFNFFLFHILQVHPMKSHCHQVQVL